MLGATGVLVAVLIAASLGASPRPAVAKEAMPGMKSESDAALYSILGTGVPIGIGALVAGPSSNRGLAASLIVGGYLAGPSLGHFYAKRRKRALTGIGIRTGTSLALAAVILSWEGETIGSGAASLAVMSALVGAVSALVDIGEAPKSARIHNEEVSRQKLILVPALIGDDGAPGLQVHRSF